jgi:Family of unknown function (DUF5723)
MYGQENFGAMSTNYSPTNSVHINPTSMLDAKTWLDFELIGAGSYINNNFIFGRNTSIRDVIKNQDFTEDDLGYAVNKAPYHLYNRTFVQSLIGVWSQGDHAVGISVAGYAYTDVRGIDETMGRFIENGVQNFTVQHLIDYKVKKLKVNSLGYAEAKISYAYTFKKERNVMMMGGFSFKKIFPIVGAAVSIRNLDYNVNNDSILRVDRLVGDAMVQPNPQFVLNGGWGIDLGFTFQKMKGVARNYFPNSKRGGCKRLFYKYKLGISILDLGYAKFPENSITYVGYELNPFNILNYANIQSDFETFPEQFVENESSPEQGFIKKPYKMSLPTSISVQFDYNLWKNLVYINATWLHGIPPFKWVFGPRRAHSLSVTPRFESKIFDLAMPLSLYEYRYPQLGLSFRLYFLTVGTDKLINMVRRKDIYGADIYFHIKIPLFRNPKCAFKGKKNGGFRKKIGGKWAKIPYCDAYH